MPRIKFKLPDFVHFEQFFNSTLQQTLESQQSAPLKLNSPVVEEVYKMYTNPYIFSNLYIFLFRSDGSSGSPDIPDPDYDTEVIICLVRFARTKRRNFTSRKNIKFFCIKIFF